MRIILRVIMTVPLFLLMAFCCLACLLCGDLAPEMRPVCVLFYGSIAVFCIIAIAKNLEEIL